jgi:hypothetical protein
MGMTKIVCYAPLFSGETMAISSIQPMVLFCLSATLCENGGTLDVMVRSEDIFIPLIVPHPIFKAYYLKVSKV